MYVQKEHFQLFYEMFVANVAHIFETYDHYFLPAINIHTNEEVAIKLEPMSAQHPQLHIECKFYKVMQGGSNIKQLLVNLHFKIFNEISNASLLLFQSVFLKSNTTERRESMS